MNNSVHVMVDIETLGNAPRDGVILSIGAIAFDPLNANLEYPIEEDFESISMVDIMANGNLGRFYSPIQIASSLYYGLKIEADTLRWWTQEGREVELAKILNSKYAAKVTEVLTWFAEWLRDICPDKNSLYLWSHGATFDVVHLEQKYNFILDQKPPFLFRNVRDTRTIYALYKAKFGKEVEWPAKRRNHHPLEDSWAQAVSVARAWSLLCQTQVMEEANKLKEIQL